jgi:hypothetical protein
MVVIFNIALASLYSELAAGRCEIHTLVSKYLLNLFPKPDFPKSAVLAYYLRLCHSSKSG